MNTFIIRLGTVAAFVFLGIVLARGLSDLPTIDVRSGTFLIGSFVALALYVAGQIIGAVAWRAVLNIYDVSLARGRAESQLLLSQIGKFIPGNVAHLFGRLTLAREDGVATTTAGAAMLLEIGALLTTGLLVVGAIILFDPVLVGQLTTDLPDTVAARLAALMVVFVFIGLIIGQIILWRRAGRPVPTLRQICLPILLHVANFIVLGASLWWVTGAIAGDAVPLLHCVAVFTVAWSLGFLMPGAPGGIGVRDGIIALGLEIYIGQGSGLGVAVAHRVISVLGDLATFGIGWVMRRRYR